MVSTCCIAFDRSYMNVARSGPMQPPRYLCLIPPMKSRGSGAIPENSAPLKSKPGCCKAWKDEERAETVGNLPPLGIAAASGSSAPHLVSQRLTRHARLMHSAMFRLYALSEY